MHDRFAIEIDNLIKSYPGRSNPTLNGLSLKIPAGSLFGLLAPNGAGKTTTIDILCGLKKFNSGTISVNGFKVPRN